MEKLLELLELPQWNVIPFSMYLLLVTTCMRPWLSVSGALGASNAFNSEDEPHLSDASYVI